MHDTSASIRDQFCEDLIAHIRARGLAGKQARTPSYVLDALVSVSRPIEGFWASIDVDLVTGALDEFGRNVPRTVEDYQRRTRLRQRVADHIFMKQHDERNAQMLARLPTDSRPCDSLSATVWICTELERLGDIVNLEYAEVDGRKCGRAALQHLAFLEAANDTRARVALPLCRATV
ncbi:hypothetical protein IQ285_12950 [Burkholderia sp. R-69608]|uniref:hypothetical protein n=1 Tax=Paraburkholderia nemoris TaxID=2793076 RepID=UPI00191383EC|nr:hypothetical protein [Paraburkholderia nemoris]MBK5148590.1 hypothetical protein [Burkholderia sp. R-69608]